MKLSVRLKNIRKEAGLTQAQLSEKLGISEATLKRYEKDPSKMPVNIVSKIASFCSVDEGWLFTGTKEKVNETLLTRFQDQKKATVFNELLIFIEREDPEGYSELFKEANTIFKTIKRLKEQSKKIS